MVPHVEGPRYGSPAGTVVEAPVEVVFADAFEHLHGLFVAVSVDDRRDVPVVLDWTSSMFGSEFLLEGVEALVLGVFELRDGSAPRLVSDGFDVFSVYVDVSAGSTRFISPSLLGVQPVE